MSEASAVSSAETKVSVEKLNKKRASIETPSLDALGSSGNNHRGGSDPAKKRAKKSIDVTDHSENDKNEKKRAAIPIGEKANFSDAEKNRKESLPIFNYKQQILSSVRTHATTVVVGETGSGKSTQIPQFLASEKSISRGKGIVCTQPRRVAAITIAEQVAKERQCRLGEEVGYSIRFEDKTTSRTKIKYVTDGVLLREIMSDPLLSSYSVVILDEAHERSMQTDILIGLLKEVQKVRHDLKIVVMSATLQVELFRGFFQDVSVVNVPGRQYPVSIFYTRTAEADFIDAALIACLQIHEEEEPGGILVFLPGQEDIESLQQLLLEHLPSIRSKHGGVARALPSTTPPPSQSSSSASNHNHPASSTTADSTSNNNHTDNSNNHIDNSSNTAKEINADHLQDFLILPLYAALSPDEQLRAFAIPPPGIRKIVLATNIAETSVTISGIRYVVDTGYAKTRSLANVTGIESLQTLPISQAQALQRAGRAGRESAGVCYRLYPEQVFEQLSETSIPEIQRMNLAQVVLQLISLLSPNNTNSSNSNNNGSSSSSSGGFLHIRSIRDFPFLSPPSITGMKQALMTLLRLQALNMQQQLTTLGRQMSLLPLTPNYAKMLLSAPALHCTAETLTAVALLSTENLFISPHAELAKQQAQQRHRLFYLPEGDLPSLIHIYHAWSQANHSKHWAERHFLSQRALLHAQSVRTQLVKLLVQHMPGIDVMESSWPQNKNAFCHCLLLGLSANIAVKAMVADQFVGTHSAQSSHVMVNSSGKVVSYSNNNNNSNNNNGGSNKNHRYQHNTSSNNIAPYRTLESHQGVFLHPSSSLFPVIQKGINAKMPAYLVYAELLVTTKHYMRNVTVVSEELVALVMTEQQQQQQQIQPTSQPANTTNTANATNDMAK